MAFLLNYALVRREQLWGTLMTLFRLALVLPFFLGGSHSSGILTPTRDPVPLLCDLPFFERLGDLPGDAHYSEARDLDYRGVVLVGESWADDPGVPNDGLSFWAGGTNAHAYQAIAYVPACSVPGQLGIGLTGLGYYFPTDRAESVAHGVSPDGSVIVGWCNAGTGIHTQAARFRSDGTKILLGMLPGHQSSATRKVSGIVRRRTPGTGLSGAAPGPRGQLKSGDRVIVGFSSTGNDIPQKVVGGQAVYWRTYGPPQSLGSPALLPNGQPVISAEAISVSDDGETIAGSLYYYVNNGEYRAYPCVWELLPDGTYDTATVLDVLPSGADNAVIADLSGNGLVAVGMSWDVLDVRACVWRKQAGGWSLVGLDVLPGMDYSIALAVDYDGLHAVGNSGWFDPDTGDYGLRRVRWTLTGANPIEDLQPLLDAAYPAQGIDDAWLIEATAISGDGRIIGGRSNYPAPTPGDPYATLDEGWIARMP